MEQAQIFHQLWLAAGMIAVTTFVHGVFIAAAAAAMRGLIKPVHGILRFFRDSFTLVILTLWLMMAHLLEIAMWAWLYIRYDLLPGWEPALYFSASSYTTLGFGDVLLPEVWRLLSGATAANGFLLFGFSAAFLFEAVRQLHVAGRNSAN